MVDGIRRRLVASASALLIATSVVAPASAVARADANLPATSATGSLDAPTTTGQSRRTETATRTHIDIATAERAAKQHPRAAHRPSPMRPVPHSAKTKPPTAIGAHSSSSGGITRLKARTAASTTRPKVATAAAVAAPPYTALFLDGGTEAAYFANEVDTYALSNATFLVQTDLGGTGNIAYVEATGPNGSYAVDLVAPDGAELAPGTYADAVFPAALGSGQPGMFIAAHNTNCDGTGAFTITEFAHTGTTLTKLAASFSWTCPGFVGSIVGAVRYGATSGLSAMSVHPSPDAIGNVPIGLTTPETITIENSGTTTLSLSSFSLTGSSAFALGANACASGTLAAGASCTTTVNVHPTATGAPTATLTWTDDSTRGSHAVPLSATAVVQLDVAIAGGQAGSAVDVYPPSWTTPAETCASASCSFDVTPYANQTLRLVARPPVGGAFTTWSQDCSGRTPCLLSMTTSRAATATLAPILTAGATNLRVVDGQAGTSDTEFGCPVAPCFEPPDPVVAVSATQVVSATNATMRIRDRAGTLLGDLPLWAFFNEPATTVIGGDPQVVWNASHGRWVASEFSGDCQHGYLHVAISDTANAAGGWLVYRFTLSSSIVDFPGLGISSDKVVVGGNLFDIGSVSCDVADFQNPIVYELSLATMLVGGSVTAAVVQLPGTFTPRPAVVMDGTASLPIVVDTGDAGAGPTGVGYFVITGAGPSARFGPIYDLTLPSNLPPYNFGAPLPGPVDPPDPAGFVASGQPVIDGRPVGVWVKGGDLWFSSNTACTPPTDGSSRACARVTRVHLTSGFTATALTGSSPLADLWVTSDGSAGPIRFEVRWRPTVNLDQGRAAIHFGSPASPGPVMFHLCPPPGSIEFCPFFDAFGGTRSSADLVVSAEVPTMTAAISAITAGNAYLEMYSDFGGPPANDTKVAIRSTSVVDRSVFDDVIGLAGSDTFDAAVGWATDGTIYLSATESGGGSTIRTVATWAAAATTDGTFATPAIISRGQTTYGASRWGDYLQIAADPADSHGVWTSQEYVTSNTSWQAWSSHLLAGSTAAPSGTATINAGATSTFDPIVVLDLESSAGTRATEARVSDASTTSAGILTAGRPVPLGHPTLWSLIDPAVGGAATTGTKHVYIQFGDGRGTWSVVQDKTITLAAHPAVTRFAGGDRYSTAAAISAGSFSSGAPVVFVATGTNFPDALAGAAVAGRIGAPVLLVTASAIPAATRTELGRLKPDRIVILGGTSVVSGAVATALGAYAPGGVFRIAGTDRYSTAAEIAFNYFFPGVDTAFIATGSNFPDALAGAAVAGKVGGPILLASATSLPTATRSALAYLQPQRIVILGGTSVISTSVATALKTYTAGSVTRVAGADRYATAAAISTRYFPTPGVSAVFVATGTNFPDALAGAAAAGHLGVPIILVTPTAIPSSAAAELERLNPGRIVILGGTSVVSAAVALQLGAYIGP